MPVLPFTISYNKGIRGKFNFPSKSAFKRQNEPQFINSTTDDVIDIHDKIASGDEEFESKGSLDSTSTERRVYYEPLDLNISPEPLMSSFPPGFLKNSFIHPNDRDKRRTREGSSTAVDREACRRIVPQQLRESIGDGFDMGFDDDAEDVIAKLQGMDASTFVGIPSSPGASQSHISPPAPSTVDLNHTTSTWKRNPPAPIQISTNPGAPPPEVQDAEAESIPSQSQLSTPESSAVSGTTLARALINNTFVLSIDTRDSRKYRSGASTLTRSDSATLPTGDYSFFSPNYDAPPVPPMPSEAELIMLASKASTPQSLVYRRKTGEFRRRSSTGSLNPSPSAQSGPVASSDIPVTAVIDTDSVKQFRRISRISEITSSLPGTPARITNDVEVEVENNEDEAATASSPEVLSKHDSNEKTTSQEQKSEAVHQVPPKPLPELPLSPISTAENVEQTVSPREFDIDSYYSAFSPDSLPRGFRPAFSPITEVSEPTGSSASPTGPSPAQKRYFQRSSMISPLGSAPLSPDYRKGSLSYSASNPRNYARLPIRERPWSQLASPSYRGHRSSTSYSSMVSGSDLIAPPVGDIFRRKRSGSAPNPIVVVPDPEFGKYRITISPNNSDTPPSTSGAGTQTFPETPDIYSPNWSEPSALGMSSPASRPLPHGEADAFPQTPTSATALLTRVSTVARLSRIGATRSMGARPAPVKGIRAKEMTVKDGAPSTQGQIQSRVAVNGLHTSEGTESQPSVASQRDPSDSVNQSSHLSAGEDVDQSERDPLEGTHQQELSLTSNETIDSTEHLSPSDISDQLRPAASSSRNVITQQSSSSSLNRAPSPTLQPSTPLIRAESMGDSPPPYDTVFGDRLASGSPPATPGYDPPSNFRRSPHISTLSLGQESPIVGSRRPRQRPRLPIGPRERRDTNTGSMTVPLRDRNGSISSMNSTMPSVGSSHPMSMTIQSPKFQVPSPKFKGVTMEAAKWTFTSTELQAIVSHAIRESAEGSSIRLLHLQTLDSDIPEDMRRLEAEGREIQSKYKILSRRRQKLLDGLSNSLSSPGNESPGASLRVIETLKEVSSQMDKLAEDLHSVDEQIARLHGIVLKHSGGALALALRKLNKSWLEKVAELDAMKLEVQRLEAEREEAYRQADELLHRVANQSSDTHHRMSVRRFKAGLHSAASRRSSFNSNRMSNASFHGSAAKSPFTFEDIPPVPSIPRNRGNVREMYVNIPPLASQSIAAPTTGPTPETPDLKTLYEQELLYGDIERRINSLRRSRSFTVAPLTAEPRGRPVVFNPYRCQNSPASSVPPRPSSLPGGSGLSDAKRAMNADTDAMLVTLRLLSDTSA